jgi:altronate hydrolase
VIIIHQVLQIHPTDNVSVALAPLATGEVIAVNGLSVTVLEEVPVGHKLALRDIAAGDPVRKYGFTIGHATRPIRRGEWVHSHNVATALHDKLEYRYEPSFHEPPVLTGQVPAFQGYRRGDGRVGIRNEIWIINTVGCINKQSERLAELARQQYQPQIAAGRIDGVYAFSHPYGCSQLGEDLHNTQKLLAGLVGHPNAGGVLVVGLGCENNQMADFQKILGPVDPNRVKFLVLQEVADELAVGLQLLGELIDFAGSFQPEPVPVSELTIGLKCGGSDGFSGITANPLVGAVADRLIAYGGTAILSEVPEMFGAETILMNRAKDQATFEKVVALINDFKDYFIRNGQEVYENPSPGNKDGGITTLEDKSLGCTQKGGTSIVTDVLRYGERSRVKGLNLLEGPGNDIVSCTALAAAGAQIILFTTGRGNPMGAIVPTIKVSTNGRLAQEKPHWIDFNAGKLLEGSTMEQLSGEFFQYLLAVAGKEQLTQNERNGYRDMAIFKSGVTL